jgi:hypothetical protein
MQISLTNSRVNGFMKWSGAHRAGNDDHDDSGGAAPIALTDPSLDNAAEEAPRHPGIAPGTRSTL